MRPTTQSTAAAGPRLASVSLLGAAAWLLVAALRWRTGLGAHLPEALLGLAAVGAVPLGLSIAFGRRLTILALAAALPLAVGLLLSPGGWAVGFSLPWIAPALAAAALALSRLARRGPGPIEELALDVGALYLPAATVWLLAARAGRPLFGFAEPLVSLTAAHFTFAGFAAATLAGGLGRLLLGPGCGAATRAVYRVATGVALAAVPLVAAGIAASPGLEVAASLLLAAALVGLAAVALGLAPRLPPLSAGLVAMAGATVLFTMTLAAIYALGVALGRPPLSIADMIDLHGVANAVGFALAGLAGVALCAPPPRHGGTRAPFSRIAGGWRIGPEFFARRDVEIAEPLPEPGLLDSIDELAGPDLDAAALDPEIRRFYEETGTFAIHVVPRWRPVARPAAVLFRRLAVRIGQLALPLDRVADAEMESRLAWLRPEADGRSWPRAWIRTYAGSGETAYAAAYAMHRRGDAGYMNIAFPLPGGHMTSVLRLEARGPVLALTSRHAPDVFGDEGIFYVAGGRPIRLPMNETIEVAARRDAHLLGLGTPPPAAGASTLCARHDVWVLGLRVLTLEYWLAPRQT